MARLWWQIQKADDQAEDQNEAWKAIEVPPTGFMIGFDKGGLEVFEFEFEKGLHSVLFLPSGEDTERYWVMMLQKGVARCYVNGQPVSSGLRVIVDRDEIVVVQSGRADRLFFSTQRPATVEPFPGMEYAVHCRRCKKRIEVGQLAVRCPNPDCCAWHHATDELPCWTYDRTCAAGCGQSTVDEEASLWTPAEL